MSVAGVDGCHEGWIAIRLDGADVTAVAEEDFEDVWDACENCEHVVVDVPIGLLSGERDDETDYKRCCDTITRQCIASSSSVFQVPVREVVDAWAAATPDRSAARAKTRQQELTGKSLTSQALALLPKIVEVDEFVRAYDRGVEELSNRLFESHPELCFTALNGGEPLRSSKSAEHSDAGLFERYALLREVFGEGTASTLWECLGSVSDQDVTFDDILDAFVLALTAREEFARTPTPPGEDPETGWPIAMAYAPVDAFDDALAKGDLPEST